MEVGTDVARRRTIDGLVATSIIAPLPMPSLPLKLLLPMPLPSSFAVVKYIRPSPVAANPRLQTARSRDDAHRYLAVRGVGLHSAEYMSTEREEEEVD